jgi:hypothetical protein
VLGKVPDNPAAILEPAGSNLAGRDPLHLDREELVSHFLDCERGAGYAQGWFPASVQVSGKFVISAKSRVWLGPYAEEMDVAVDLLAPLAIGVWRKGKGRIQLLWLGASSFRQGVFAVKHCK